MFGLRQKGEVVVRTQIIGSLVRVLLGALGGSGLMSDGDVQQLSGALTLVGTLLWAGYRRYKEHKEKVAKDSMIAATFILILLALLPVTAQAQTLCPNPCTVARSEPFTVLWDLNTAVGGPVAEYRIYMALGTGAPAVVARVPVGSPTIVNDVLRYSNPAGTTAPDGTYSLVLAAANGISSTAVESRSDPIPLIVLTPVLPAAPAKPSGGRIIKP